MNNNIIKNKVIKSLAYDNKILLMCFLYMITFTIAITFLKPQINIDKNINTNIENLNVYQNRILFNKDDIKNISGIKEEELEKILKNTNLEDITPYILKAEKEYKINAIFLTSLVINNSNYGNSYRAIKYNNLTNVGITDKNPNGIKYESREDSIMECAKLLSEEYLTPSGNYFNGYSVEAISKNYCNSKVWLEDIIDTSKNIVNKINS